jgi:transcriptional regulator with XRE-family HTH domain
VSRDGRLDRTVGGEAVSGLGQLLKKARQERGITLEELQETTKIRIRYLQAIEEENFSVLPGNFYVRAFIKSYAEAVGLNPEEIVRMYQNVIPSSNPDVKMDSIRPKARSRSNTNTDRIARWAASLLVVFFLALIFVIIYYFVLSNENERGGQEDRVVNDPPIVSETEEEIGGNGPEALPEPNSAPPPEPEPEPEREPTLTFAATDGSTHVYTVTNADRIRLELRLPNGRCWVQVKEGSGDGKEIVARNYNQGETEIFEVADSLYIRLGYPRAAELWVNGIQVDADKLSGENPVNFQFNLVKMNSG